MEPVLVLMGLVKARLKVEFSYDHMMETIQTSVWVVGRVLCSLGREGLIANVSKLDFENQTS